MTPIELSNLELGMLSKLLEFRLEQPVNTNDPDSVWLRDFYSGLKQKLDRFVKV